jgi:hypothetical protein
MPSINNTPALYEISKKGMMMPKREEQQQQQHQHELVLSGQQPYKLFIESYAALQRQKRHTHTV